MATNDSYTIAPEFLSQVFSDGIPQSIRTNEQGFASQADLNTEIHRLWREAMTDCQET
jgi:hypothetical protein